MLHKYLCKFQHYPDVKTSTDTTMQFSTAITDSYFILALFRFTPITYILTELSFLVTLPFDAAIISLALFFKQLSALLPETNITGSNTASNMNWFEEGRGDQQVNYPCIPYLKISYLYCTPLISYT